MRDNSYLLAIAVLFAGGLFVYLWIAGRPVASPGIIAMRTIMNTTRPMATLSVTNQVGKSEPAN